MGADHPVTVPLRRIHRRSDITGFIPSGLLQCAFFDLCLFVEIKMEQKTQRTEET